jgi:two-component system nitrogen regulation response regulator NtrX
MNKILVVDDEQVVLDSVSDILEDEGYDIVQATGGESCLDIMNRALPDLVLLDIWMPGMDGLAVLERIKEAWADIPVVIMSGHGNVETAVKATRLGAYDFIEKPLSYDSLILTIQNAIKFHELQNENVLLKEKASQAGDSRQLTGKSPAMQRLLEQIRIVAPTDAWVLIHGENGTGKELVAQTIHRLSRRSHKPLVEVNCAAIPEELIESEMFGHEKGAFTGASSMKRGKFDLAHQGILFLDEIGDMSLNTQAKVLRILQEQKFERVGGSRTIKVDVRILAATNKDLEEEIRQGNFREDLYFRLNVIPIEVPPLRERKEDIPILAGEFLSEFATGFARGRKKTLSPQVIKTLQEYDWPGNVRELRNLVERLIILSRGDVIEISDLPPSIKKGGMTETGLSQEAGGAPVPAFMQCNDFRKARAMFEKEFIETRLRKNLGNIKKTAEEIGIERRHLYRKIKTLGIEN